ncbi:hypothetical protein [uncultured Dokdonia sp.]|uniref:hypothetical protein n=1 Tax=uncultured Dokdonia sp. TaxID=575653 RepID=UPI00261322CB|nr:hypothetical protein [uncultured Dokdonia sp.]
MKKKNLKGLTLDKTTISNLKNVNGGGNDSRPTVNTRELSFCIGIGIPDTCLSIDPCA